MQRRVAVSGIGAVTAVGTGRAQFWERILAGRCAIAPVRSFDTKHYTVHYGAELENFEPAKYVHNQDPGSMGRASQFAIAAARLGLADAGLEPSSLEPERCGVSMGTTSGEPRVIERFDDCYVGGEMERVGPEFVWTYPCHVIADHVANELGLAGAHLTVASACAAGNHAIAHAYDAVRWGRADLMLAGGSDCFSRITFTGFARLGAIAPRLCQPFDRNRKGMIPGEGAGVLVLEPLDRARGRGARIYAEITGYGLSCDAHHMTAAHPSGDGAVRAMGQALRESGTRPEEVSYISAHGTGTPTNDRLETVAVKKIFGDAAFRIPVSSIKSMLGHAMGAASAIEAACCALAVFYDRVPPTIHLEEPDPDCDLDYVPNQAREVRVQVAMNNAYAFGGNNASLILRKCQA